MRAAPNEWLSSRMRGRHSHVVQIETISSIYLAALRCHGDARGAGRYPRRMRVKVLVDGREIPESERDAMTRRIVEELATIRCDEHEIGLDGVTIELSEAKRVSLSDILPAEPCCPRLREKLHALERQWTAG